MLLRPKDTFWDSRYHRLSLKVRFQDLRKKSMRHKIVFFDILLGLKIAYLVIQFKFLSETGNINWGKTATFKTFLGDCLSPVKSSNCVSIRFLHLPYVSFTPCRIFITQWQYLLYLYRNRICFIPQNFNYFREYTRMWLMNFCRLFVTWRHFV